MHDMNKHYNLRCTLVSILQVGIDLIGPLPLTAKGNKYIVTLLDYFSKWPEAAPLPNKTAIGVANFLYEEFCRLVKSSCMSLCIISSIDSSN